MRSQLLCGFRLGCASGPAIGPIYCASEFGRASELPHVLVLKILHVDFKVAIIIMSISPIITFKAGACDFDVSPQSFLISLHYLPSYLERDERDFLHCHLYLRWFLVFVKLEQTDHRRIFL